MFVLPGKKIRPFRQGCLRPVNGGDFGVEPDWLFEKGWFAARFKKRLSFSESSHWDNDRLAQGKTRTTQREPHGFSL